MVADMGWGANNPPGGPLTAVADLDSRIIEPTGPDATFTRAEAQDAIERVRDGLSKPLYEIALMAEQALQMLPEGRIPATIRIQQQVFDLLEGIITEVAKAPLSQRYIKKLLGQ